MLQLLELCKTCYSTMAESRPRIKCPVTHTLVHWISGNEILLDSFVFSVYCIMIATPVTTAYY